MRHLVFREAGTLEWQSAPDPAPGPGAALIRPTAVARCDLDPIMAALGIFPGPFPAGHEAAGEVVAVGDGVARHGVGSHVAVPFQVSCGTCDRCRRRRYAACRTHYAKAGAAFGFGEAGGCHGGAVADLLLVPDADHLLAPTPTGLDAVSLALITDNAIDAYRAVGPALASDPGADVLIVGGAAPSIGLFAVALAVALGAGEVRYADRDPQRCRLAERLGASATQLEGGWPRNLQRASITVENTAEPEGLECTIRSTDDYGVCTPVAIHFTPSVPLPMLAMYTRGITLNVSRADSRRYIDEVLALAGAGRFDPTCVEPELVDFEEAEEAWLAPATKLVLVRR